MSLTIGEKLRVVLKRKDISVQDLADMLGQSRQNINTKIKKDNFSEQDIRKIAKVLNVGFEAVFILEDGERI